MSKKTKTEHSGAKNGGGFRGKREEAKQVSKERRRQIDKELERNAEVLERLVDCSHGAGSKPLCEHGFCPSCGCPNYCWID